MRKALLLAGVIALVANTANAEMKPYVGFDGNFSSLDWAYDFEKFAENDYQSGSFIAGARLHKNFGVEAFYQISGNENNTTRIPVMMAEVQNAAARNNARQENVQVRTRFNAYGLDALGYLPLGCEGKVELLAGLGLAEYIFKTKIHTQGTQRDHSLGYRFNFGAQYNFDENWSVRGMYRHVYTQKSYVDAVDELSLGVRYNF